MSRNVITVKRAGRLIAQMAGESMHAKRILSVTNAVIGVVNAVSLSIHAIGAGLAQVSGLNAKHAIKQVDRLLSNSAVGVWALFAHWVPHVVAASQEIVVVLDWTDFDADGHSTIALYVVTAHGRAMPLVWKSVPKERLKDRRNDYEDEVLMRLHEVLPPGVKVTVLADRGFGDKKLSALLKHLGFGFVIRFRGDVTVESRDGEVRAATEWVPPNGRIRPLRGARVTTDRYELALVACVKARGMKDGWCLAVHGDRLTGAMAVKLYGRRFTIEETFRDTKDPRYGLGLSATHVRDVGRRDRLLLICAMAMTLLTILGAAGESLGMDRMLKANTVKKRTHSLFRQGCHYYASIPAMKPPQLEALVQRFGESILREPVSIYAFGLK
jgi:Transposase DDE domain